MSNKVDGAFQKFTDFLEWVPCDSCGVMDYEVIYRGQFREKDFSFEKSKSFTYASRDRARGDIVRCKKCGLVYMNPRDKDVSSLYREVAHDHYYLSSEEDRKLTFTRDLVALENFSGPGKDKKILDVGCSYGFFMEVARDRGFEVYGLELSREQAAISSAKGFPVCEKEIKECHYPDNFFDAVALYDVIEHLPSPLNFLKDVHRILRTDGLLSLTTPDLESWPAKIAGRYWMNFCRMHFYYFTPATMRNLLSAAGFKIVAIKRHRRIVKLGVAVEWLRKYPLLYSPLKLLLGNRLVKNLTVSSGLSGNILIFARKE